MWKNAASLRGSKKNASTGGVEDFWPLSTGRGWKTSYPHYATSYPHLSVDNNGSKEAGRKSPLGASGLDLLRRDGKSRAPVIHIGC